MGSKICMNKACGTTASVEWKSGWDLRSGGFATLCFKCGYAYENLAFCDTFHLEETGWRECSFCKKRLHCGCVASKSLLELLEFGGVGCTSCARSYQTHSIPINEVPNDIDTSALNMIGPRQSTPAENLMNAITVNKAKLLLLGNFMETSTEKGDKNRSNGIMKQEESMHPNGALESPSSNIFHSSISKQNNSIPILPLSNSLNSNSEIPNFTPTFPDHNKASSSLFQQGQRSCPILPKPSKNVHKIVSEANKGIIPQGRVARPPAEGRGRNQLLPRYWPRITDQELQQLSGDLNSTIVPLFEKVLSASDAGRIGRLVLPKACAEAYFPPVTQSEGIPIRIQDEKGKEWTFQFRFWPNNNSRMYVLEGVTPCIQSMQLQAGDTVTFSRNDPEGKLVIGSRKASIFDTQDGETSSLPNGALLGEMSFTGIPTTSPYSTMFQSPKDFKDHVLNTHCKLDEHVNWPKTEKLQIGPSDNNNKTVQRPMMNAEKKRSRNLGNKNKRLLMNSDDAMELRLTWEEAQDLLRPPPRVKPTIVTIEDHEFEEYDEPPVFGKRSHFTARLSGEQEQWTQCDDCFKWRRLPVDFLLPSKWTCSDNIWDPSRCSCSAPEEINPKEVEYLFKPTKDFKRRKTTETHMVLQEREPSGLDALASAAILGENMMDPPIEESSIIVEATTKHPRHRPGCTCIVCIQPPSGKGKHNPSCMCNVCSTVKRRLETSSLRKKIRQSQNTLNTLVPELSKIENLENEMGKSVIIAEVGETSNGKIDLNCEPDVQNEEIGNNMMMNVVEVKQSEQQESILAPCSSSLPKGDGDIQEKEKCSGDEIENGGKSVVRDEPT